MAPRLSICIPTYNRAERLGVLLESIEEVLAIAQIDPASIEVVVVIDGSTDETYLVLEDKAKNFPSELRFVWQENAGLAAARNALVRLANGHIVWFLDDDLLISLGALEGHLQADRLIAEVLSGPSHIVTDYEGISLFYEWRWNQLREAGFVTNPEHLSFANTSAPRALLQKHPFDESFVDYGFEDYELGLRMIEAGVIIAYAHDAKVDHHFERSAYEMLKNARGEGVNRSLLRSIHPEVGAFATEVEPRKFANMIRPLRDRGWATPLWVAALALLPLSRLPGKWGHNAAKFGHDLALESGLAQHKE